jgi:glycosyltransferase involved in cell wall biosynthesis
LSRLGSPPKLGLTHLIRDPNPKININLISGQASALGYPAWNLTYRKELQYSNKAVSVSMSLKDELLEEMGERYEKKILTIHNGINMETLDKEYEQAGSSIQESENTILFAGRLIWRKGALNIVKMASLLKEKKSRLKIIVHGTGPLFNQMQTIIQSQKLDNIDLKGFTTRAQLIRSMKLCKFVAIPSVYEACPMILLEGMSLGKIPLMLNLPFSLELTKNGKYGILANNLEGLTDRLIELNNQHDLHRISYEIRVFARSSYDVKNTVHKYLDVYRELSS